MGTVILIICWRMEIILCILFLIISSSNIHCDDAPYTFRVIDSSLSFKEALEKCLNKEHGSDMITVQNLALLPKYDESGIYRVNAVKDEGNTWVQLTSGGAKERVDFTDFDFDPSLGEFKDTLVYSSHPSLSRNLFVKSYFASTTGDLPLKTVCQTPNIFPHSRSLQETVNHKQSSIPMHGNGKKCVDVSTYSYPVWMKKEKKCCATVFKDLIGKKKKILVPLFKKFFWEKKKKKKKKK